jgi:Pretoxin HINT domain
MDRTTYLGSMESTVSSDDAQSGLVKREIITDSGPPKPPPESTSQKFARYLDNGLAIPGGVYSRLPSFLQGNIGLVLTVAGAEALRDPVDPLTNPTSLQPVAKETIDAVTSYHQVANESGRFQRDSASTRNGSSASVGAGLVWDGGWSLPDVNLGSSSSSSSGQNQSNEKQAYDYSGDYREWGAFRITPNGEFRDPSDYTLVEHLDENSDRHGSGSYTSTVDGQTSSGNSHSSDSYNRDLTHTEEGWISSDGNDFHPDDAIFDETRAEDGDYDSTFTSPTGSSHSWGDHSLDSTLHQDGVGPNADFDYHLETLLHSANTWSGPSGASSSSANTAETFDLSRVGGLTTGHRVTHSWGSFNGQPYDNTFIDNNPNGIAPLYAGPSYFRPGPTMTEADLLIREGANISLMFANGATFGKIPLLKNQVDKIKGDYGDMESVLYYAGAVTTVAVVVTAAVAVTVASGGTVTAALIPIGIGAGIGAGLGFGHQTAEMLDGTRPPGDYGAREIISDAGLGAAMGALYNCGIPVGVLRAAQFGFMGMGIVSGLQNIRNGNYATGAFDLVTSVVPFAFRRACFVAGTPIRTESGSKRIEQIAVGDKVLSRSECDPSGPVRAKSVLQTFVRTSAVINLHVSGRVIGTTAEHPFYAENKGWTPAIELRIGERVLLESGGWMRVDGVADSGRVEAVYNMEVEDDHTYFVGEAGWGFAVWSHNIYEVGPYNRIRRFSLLNVREANHAPQSALAELLIGGFNRRKAISISILKSEHDVVSYWQNHRREYFGKNPASARELLAQDVVLLRRFTNAPGSALRDLVRQVKARHPYDFFPHHRM